MACSNSDILALIDYFENGTDLSNNDWDNYNYYDLWNALENGASPPSRTVCATFTQADILSITLAVLGTFTTPSEYLGFNRDFYYLYLKAIGSEDPSPTFTNECIGALYDVFTTGAYSPADDTELFDWWNVESQLITDGGDPAEMVSWLGLKGNAANPPTVTSRPLYGNTQINGLDILSFRSIDPNYIEIDVSTLSSNCCLYMVVQGDSSGSTQYLVCNSISVSNRIAKSGTTSTSIVGLGSSITVYQNGLSVYDQTMTRTQLNTLISSNSLVTFDGLDFTGVNTIYLFVRDSLGNATNGLLGDVIISTGNTFISENNNFLINKYGF